MESIQKVNECIQEKEQRMKESASQCEEHKESEMKMMMGDEV